ncbi:MAG TPA: SIMPL domain-containing protein [Aggregatilineales bacterium]|nr:SIMPL domain-containing protein [Aggregatilineales bacterium]
MNMFISRMKIVFPVMVAVALFSSGSVLASGNAQIGDSIQNSTIEVTGDAQINVVPDKVVIALGVETSDKVLANAKSDNDARIARILALTKSMDISPENVQTDYISVEPRYDNYSSLNFVGYFVRKTVIITVKDITKFDAVLSGAIDSGANFVQGVQFLTSDLRKYRDQARTLAIQAAKDKAVALAGELGQKVGKPISITEQQNSWWASYGNWWGQQYQSQFNQQSQNVVQNAVSSGPTGSLDNGDTVAPGQIAVTARVSVTFQLAE